MAAGAQTIKHRDIEPLAEPKAWKALEVHYKKIRRSHLVIGRPRQNGFAAGRNLYLAEGRNSLTPGA